MNEHPFHGQPRRRPHPETTTPDHRPWPARPVRCDITDGGGAPWTSQATHCADPTDCPTYAAVLAALRLHPDADHSSESTARAHSSPDPDRTVSRASDQRWGRVLAASPDRSALTTHDAPDARDGLDWWPPTPCSGRRGIGGDGASSPDPTA